MSLLLQRKTIFDRAVQRAGVEIDRGGRGKSHINVSRMVGQRIFAGVAKIALVRNVSACSADSDFRPADRIQMHVTTAGKHFNAAAVDVFEGHRTIDAHDAEMSIAQVAYVDSGSIAA